MNLTRILSRQSEIPRKIFRFERILIHHVGSSVPPFFIAPLPPPKDQDSGLHPPDFLELSHSCSRLLRTPSVGGKRYREFAGTTLEENMVFSNSGLHPGMFQSLDKGNWNLCGKHCEIIHLPYLLSLYLFASDAV